MYYTIHLRSKLDEQFQRLRNSQSPRSKDELFIFIDFLLKDKIFNQLLQPAIDASNFNGHTPESLVTSWMKSRGQGFQFSEYHDRAAIFFVMLKQLRSMDFRDGGHLAQNLFMTRNDGESIDKVVSFFIEPIVEYLHDRLDDINLHLSLLERYKRRVEWFTRKELLSKYKEASNSRYEDVLDHDLRLFLFDQGIEFPFSKPQTPSGMADVALVDANDDPLPLEIKVYDESKNYRKERIISGFSQIVQYANDYNQNSGYLVVYFIDQVELHITGFEPDMNWPLRIPHNNKFYYLIPVYLNFEISASKRGTLRTVEISYDELISATKQQ